jgi:hypothetical protein
MGFKVSTYKDIMLSTETRLRLEAIAAKIATCEEVSFEEMQWAQKWSDHNRSAASILSKARRVAIQGAPKDDSLDELLHGLDLGDPDPSNHLIGPQDPDTLADWFKAPPWLKND